MTNKQFQSNISSTPKRSFKFLEAIVFFFRYELNAKRGAVFIEYLSSITRHYEQFFES